MLIKKSISTFRHFSFISFDKENNFLNKEKTSTKIIKLENPKQLLWNLFIFNLADNNKKQYYVWNVFSMGYKKYFFFDRVKFVNKLQLQILSKNLENIDFYFINALIVYMFTINHNLSRTTKPYWKHLLNTYNLEFKSTNKNNFSNKNYFNFVITFLSKFKVKVDFPQIDNIIFILNFFNMYSFDFKNKSIIDNFFFYYINDYFILENLQFFKEAKQNPIMKDIACFSNTNDLTCLIEIKQKLLDFFISDFINWTLENKSFIKNFVNVINVAPFPKVKKKKLAPGSFWYKYKPKVLKNWKKGILWTDQKNYAIWHDYYYNHIIKLFQSIKYKLFVSNLSSDRISDLCYYYRRYIKRYLKSKPHEFPTAPWVQCSKWTLFKYMIAYYVDGIPQIWYDNNKLFLYSLVLDKSLINELTLKEIFSSYLYYAIVNDDDTLDLNEIVVYAFNLLKLFDFFWVYKASSKHYGLNDIIKQFSISFVTDLFVKNNFADFLKFRELSNITRGKGARGFLKNYEKILARRTGGTGPFFDGYLIRICRHQFASYLYEDILRYISLDNKNVFSKNATFSIFGNENFYETQKIDTQFSNYKISK